MNNLAIISEITDNINSLNQKIEKSDENTVKVFSYLYSIVSDVANKVNSIDTNIKSEDVGNISKKILELDLSNSEIKNKVTNVISKTDKTYSELTTNIDLLNSKDSSIQDELDSLKTKVDELEKILNTYEKISGDYIIIEKKVIRSSFFSRLKYAFSLLFKSKKIEERLDSIESTTKEINTRKAEEEREKKLAELRLEEERKKKSRDKIKNILGN